MISKNDQVTEKIYTISVQQQNFVLQQLKLLQLNEMQARSLNFISAHSGTIQRNLAEYLGKQQATVTNLLKSLEEKQLIYREIPKENERQKNIYLTQTGKELVAKVQKIFVTLDKTVQAGLTKQQQAQLETLLTLVEEQLRKNGK